MRPEEPAPPRRTIRKHKEPIFVTEVPQNAYKKKRNKGLSSSEEDEAAGADATNKAKMTAKERRQLRNKISARNFRVRRKGNNIHFLLRCNKTLISILDCRIH